MLDTLQNQLQLTGNTLALAAIVVLIASMVRGFAGFGLSAIVMGALALKIPPIELIPMCFILEFCASLMMSRGGIADGNARIVIGLVIGSALGLPLGLAITHALSPDTSRLVALALILILATLQMFKVSPGFLTFRWGVYIAGFMAGIATGLASIGGMVVALYILTLQGNPRETRGSLVLYLFISMLVTGFWLVGTGTLDTLAFTRALTLTPLLVAGILLGIWLFRPSLERFYKRFCLFMLIALAVVGLGRLLLQQS